MEYEYALFPARHDESSKEIRVEKTLWHAVLRAVQRLGGVPFEERFDPTNARRFAKTLRRALDEPGEPVGQDKYRPVINEILFLFESGTGVKIDKATPSALRAIPSFSRPVSQVAPVVIGYLRPDVAAAISPCQRQSGT